MTDREVQKLNRKDLLRFLLEAQTENESLRRDRTELRKQVKALEEALDLAKEQHAPQEAPTPLVLQETRLAADEAVFAEREALVQREQKLLEWEQRLKQQEADMGKQEEGLKKLILAADGETTHFLEDAQQQAGELRHTAEVDAAAITAQAKERAEETLRQAGQTATETVRQADRLLRAVIAR